MIRSDDNGEGFRVEPVLPEVSKGLHVLPAADRISLDRPDVVMLFHSHVGRAPVLSDLDLEQMVVEGMPSYGVSHLIFQMAADGSGLVRACLHVWDEIEACYRLKCDISSSRQKHL